MPLVGTNTLASAFRKAGSDGTRNSELTSDIMRAPSALWVGGYGRPRFVSERSDVASDSVAASDPNSVSGPLDVDVAVDDSSDEVVPASLGVMLGDFGIVNGTSSGEPGAIGVIDNPHFRWGTGGVYSCNPAVLRCRFDM